MKKYYINDKFNFIEEEVEKFMLHCEIVEDENTIHITIGTLAHYFENEIIESAQKKWSSKEIKILYRGDVHLGYHTFRYFKLKFVK